MGGNDAQMQAEPQDCRPQSPRQKTRRWWLHDANERERVTQLLDERGVSSAFVYKGDVVQERARRLVAELSALDRVYYAMKANNNAELLRLIVAEGLGVECVSAREIEFVRETCGTDVPILFTPNYAPIEEYAKAYELGAEVTVDGPDVVEQEPSIFSGRKVAIRFDPGSALARGHHKHVITSGHNAKFGHPIELVDKLIDVCAKHDVTIDGVHAHVGSGIHEADNWFRIGSALATLEGKFPNLEWVDLGGGLGVRQCVDEAELDLAQVNAHVCRIKEANPWMDKLKLRMEPGRFLVSEGGVLLSRVTQVRDKGGQHWIGVATGMNSLIRPALYEAHHCVHNLTRIDEKAEFVYHIVGPICESTDFLAHNRRLPRTKPKDIILIENAGAYGQVMSSSFNMRPPAPEIVI